MLTKEKFNQIKQEIQEVIDMYSVTINLTNDKKDHVKAKLKYGNDHYTCWVISKKIKLNKNSKYLFDADCITISLDSEHDRFTVSIDELNSGILMENYPKLLKVEHKISNPDSPPGYRLFSFFVKDQSLLMEFLAALDKHIAN